MQKRMDEVKVGETVLAYGARLVVESIVVSDPFIHLNIANSGRVIFGQPDWVIDVVVEMVLATEVKVGDVIEVVDGEPILVKSARPVGSFVQFTAFGHPSSDRWYVGKQTTVKKGKLTFEVEQSSWEYVRTFVQLPLPFEQGVL